MNKNSGLPRRGLLFASVAMLGLAAGGIRAQTIQGSGQNPVLNNFIPAVDDPTNASGLGSSQVIRGTVYAYEATGVTQGAAGNNTVRAATLTGLQAALNYADAHNKFFEIEPADYEIYGSAGLLVPINSLGTIDWHGTSKSHIVQYYNNASILTIGDVAGSSYAYGGRISGFSLDYGVSQTGNTNANALALGSCYGVIIENFIVCPYYGTNPPWNGIYINATGTAKFWFQNVMRDFAVGGSQRSLVAWHTAGTGNLISNGYTHNGSDAASRLPLTVAAWDLFINSAISSDNIIERCNIEHCNAPCMMQTGGFITLTVIGLHLEDVAITGFGAQVFSQVTGHVRFINLLVYDLVNTGASGPCHIFGMAGFGEVYDVDGLYIKWDNAFSGAMNLATTIVGVPGDAIGNSNPNDTNPAVSISNIRLQDDPGNNMQTYLTIDSNINAPLSDGTTISRYQGDNLVPATLKYQPVIKANYTHYGLHQDAVLFVPATLGAAITIGLSAKRKASGTGSSLNTPTGNTVRIRRQSGTYANTCTVTDIAGSTTLSTNSTAGVDLLYVFNGTNWVVAT